MEKQGERRWLYPLVWGILALAVLLLWFWFKWWILILFCLIFVVGTIDTLLGVIRTRNKKYKKEEEDGNR